MSHETPIIERSMSQTEEAISQWKETLELLHEAIEQRDRATRLLREILQQIDSLDDYSLTRDVEPYKAQAVWDTTIDEARKFLEQTNG